MPFPIQSVSFCADGKTIAFGAFNTGSLLVYDLRKPKDPLHIFEGHKQTVNSIAFKNKESLSTS